MCKIVNSTKNVRETDNERILLNEVNLILDNEICLLDLVIENADSKLISTLKVLKRDMENINDIIFKYLYDREEI